LRGAGRARAPRPATRFLFLSGPGAERRAHNTPSNRLGRGSLRRRRGEARKRVSLAPRRLAMHTAGGSVKGGQVAACGRQGRDEGRRPRARPAPRRRPHHALPNSFRRPWVARRGVGRPLTPSSAVAARREAERVRQKTRSRPHPPHPSRPPTASRPPPAPPPNLHHGCHPRHPLRRRRPRRGARQGVWEGRGRWSPPLWPPVRRALRRPRPGPLPGGRARRHAR